MNEENEVLQAILSAIESGYQFSDEMLGLINEFVDYLANRRATPEIPQGTDLLWILSGSNPEAFVFYLRTYPGANFAPLLNNPAQLQRVIGQLSQSMPSAAPAEEDSIPKADLNSFMDENIKSVFRDILEAHESGHEFSDEELDLIEQFVRSVEQKSITSKIPQETDLLSLRLGSNPKAYISCLQTHPRANFSKLLKNLSQLQRVIGQLSQSMPPSAPVAKDTIPKADLRDQFLDSLIDALESGVDFSDEELDEIIGVLENQKRSKWKKELAVIKTSWNIEKMPELDRELQSIEGIIGYLEQSIKMEHKPKKLTPIILFLAKEIQSLQVRK